MVVSFPLFLRNAILFIHRFFCQAIWMADSGPCVPNKIARKTLRIPRNQLISAFVPLSVLYSSRKAFCCSTRALCVILVLSYSYSTLYPTQRDVSVEGTTFFVFFLSSTEEKPSTIHRTKSDTRSPQQQHVTIHCHRSRDAVQGAIQAAVGNQSRG